MLEKILVVAISRKHNFVTRGWSPSLQQHLSEAIKQSLRKSVESQRIKPAGVLRMIPLPHARVEIRSSITLETYRENSLRRQRLSGLEQVCGALCEQLDLAGTVVATTDLCSVKRTTHNAFGSGFSTPLDFKFLGCCLLTRTPIVSRVSSAL